MTSPPIQWYPGHIAKAEKQLLEQLKKVDVVLEVRDARIPLATCHPQVEQWIGSKGRVLVLNRVDMIPPAAQQAWVDWFRTQGEQPYFTDANQGKGVSIVSQATKDAGNKMNQRRRDRGMLPRPVRAVVIGFPNVGKSALINRLVKRRVVESARRPGVTRQLRWIRISDQIELLDAPGVLPSRLEDQEAALLLAICDDIGEAAYDNQRVAAALVDRLKHIQSTAPEMLPDSPLQHRYELDPMSLTGESYVEALAEQKHQGDKERSARQLLNDFRKGLLGAIPLELPIGLEEL
ncbi:ribosome biogenesis GTPase YlqF [Egbenema bharatensis]|uniref:ribosome biogenesis GTPase YlqF n=1 Tax=Egbenema bharatensis TaxID=3463334 RepID=UPI003A888E30